MWYVDRFIKEKLLLLNEKKI